MPHRTIPGSRSLVTGASGGIGRAIALELARQGSRVVLLARRAEPLEAVAKEIRAAGGTAETVVGDVTDPAARQASIARARDRFGGLDILVNNAGIGAMGRFDEADPARLRKIFEVNFFAAVELIREALPALRSAAADFAESAVQNDAAQNPPRRIASTRPIVVNVSSILGNRGTPRMSEYCASKFALRGFSESLRAELASTGIDVLLVSPGSTETKFFDHVIDERGGPRWPVQPRVTAEHVARATVRAIRRGRHEIVPNFRGRALCLLNRLAPWLVDRVMARYG